MPLVYRWHWDVDAAPGTIWPIVSDTARFNRMAGLPVPMWTETPLLEGGVQRIARAKMAGFSLEWEEFPFEWQEGHAYSVFRVYHGGPLVSQRYGVTLDPVADRPGFTRSQVDLELEVRHFWAVPIAHIVAKGLHTTFETVHRRLQGAREADPGMVFAPPPVTLTPDARLRLAAITEALVARGADPAHVERLSTHIGTAAAEDLNRLRPFALADTWGAPRDAVLRLFLNATELGLLDLSWDLVCPHCRGAKVRLDSLGKITPEARCTSCNIDFEANFDRSIELTFRPNAAIRPIDVGMYCVGGPGNTPHIISQALLDPGVETRWPLGLRPGAYRLRGPQVAEIALLHVVADATAGEGAETGTISFDLRASGLLPPESTVKGPEVQVQVANRTDRRHLVLLERVAWQDDVVTASRVTALQEFRNLFATEALAPGVKLEVARLAFLFTDLKSSTEMYERHGDAKAFSLVRDHFDLLAAEVAKEGGAIVKTIGDAIMAVFFEPSACVRAALSIQGAFAEFNRSADVPLIVKAGAHVGPCLAVNLNDRLDYFGTTVNTAARVQGLSEGDDLVLTEELVADPGVARQIHGLECPREVQEVALKGLQGTFTLTRLRPGRSQVPHSR